MNVEIEVEGLRIKVQNTTKDHANNLLLAAIQFVHGKEFKLPYDLGQVIPITPATVEEIIPDDMEKINPIEKDRKKVKAVEGVKDYGNGELAYQCFYRCGCGYKGYRYIKGYEEAVHCHKCNEKLAVTEATPNEAHDEEFNYYLAF